MIKDIFMLFLAQHVEFNWDLLIFIGKVAFIIFCIHRIAKYFDEVKKEQKLTRMELGKLADELEQIRKKVLGDDANESSDKSG